MRTYSDRRPAAFESLAATTSCAAAELCIHRTSHVTTRTNLLSAEHAPAHRNLMLDATYRRQCSNSRVAIYRLLESVGACQKSDFEHFRSPEQHADGTDRVVRYDFSLVFYNDLSGSVVQ